MSTREEKRAIDTNPANKCRCGNTARLGQTRCGRCLDQDEQEASTANEFASLHQRIYALPSDTPETEAIRSILSDMAGLLETLHDRD
jgi:hypothetical protein